MDVHGPELVLLYALIPTLATIAGSALIFLRISVKEAFMDSFMGLASGLMIYVAFVELLIPSLNLGSLHFSFLGFLSGFLLIRVLDVLIPHTKLLKGDNSDLRGRKSLLVALAIVLHNIPEGLAVGSATIYGADEGFKVSLSIATQDFPEGLAVALPVFKASGSTLTGFIIGVVSAFSEYLSALAALIGFMGVGDLLPLLMSFSASAMIYVVVHEIAPEIFGHEHDEYSTIGFVSGTILGLIFETL
ncbi:MAG: ZIP family metal transporter [Sulfolobales archaeon]